MLSQVVDLFCILDEKHRKDRGSVSFYRFTTEYLIS